MKTILSKIQNIFKKYTFIKYVLVSMILIVLCYYLFIKEKEISNNQLQFRNGLAFEVNSDTPFSGKVINMYSKWRGEDNYKDGLLNGVSIKYYSNNTKKKEETYINGKRIGEAKSWYTNTQIRSQVTYSLEGKIRGEFTTWHENGNKMSYGIIDTTQTFNIIQRWDENGNEIGSLTYVKDRITILDFIYNNYNLNFGQIKSYFGMPINPETNDEGYVPSYGFVSDLSFSDESTVAFENVQETNTLSTLMVSADGQRIVVFGLILNIQYDLSEAHSVFNNFKGFLLEQGCIEISNGELKDYTKGIEILYGKHKNINNFTIYNLILYVPEKKNQL